MKKFKQFFKSTIWNNRNYYKKTQKNKLEFQSDQYVLKIKTLAQKSNYVLDCGCGDGSVVKFIANKSGEFHGIDISPLAIKLSKSGRKSINIKFTKMDLEKIEFPDNYFDLVYSAYVLEHLDNPEKVIREMIRVCKPRGLLIFLSPNLGSPIDYRQCIISHVKSPVTLAIKRFIKSHMYCIFNPKKLNWDKIYPNYIRKKKWQSDWDAITAPYIQTLIYFLKNQNIQIVDSSEKMITSTIWKDKNNYTFYLTVLKLFRNFITFLGNMGMSPYKYYGETLYIVGRKMI